MYSQNANSIDEDGARHMTAMRIWLWWTETIHAHRDERGASLVEYALLVALIAVVCIIAISFVGTAASTKFSSVGSNLS